MSYVRIGDTLVSEMADGALWQWLCEASKDGGWSPQERSAQAMVAIMRAFDLRGMPQTVRQVFYAVESLWHAVEKTEAGYRQVVQLLALPRTL